MVLFNQTLAGKVHTNKQICVAPLPWHPPKSLVLRVLCIVKFLFGHFISLHELTSNKLKLDDAKIFISTSSLEFIHKILAVDIGNVKYHTTVVEDVGNEPILFEKCHFVASANNLPSSFTPVQDSKNGCLVSSPGEGSPYGLTQSRPIDLSRDKDSGSSSTGSHFKNHDDQITSFVRSPKCSSQQESMGNEKLGTSDPLAAPSFQEVNNPSNGPHSPINLEDFEADHCNTAVMFYSTKSRASSNLGNHIPCFFLSNSPAYEHELPTYFLRKNEEDLPISPTILKVGRLLKQRGRPNAIMDLYNLYPKLASRGKKKKQQLRFSSVTHAEIEQNNSRYLVSSYDQLELQLELSPPCFGL
ncbi:hypothetical protein GH714_039045 [Hevea brasiliensis]|uniref:Uncharacterized protein n=1 Tax=Hevea brasiliensis TaxID=3981 RepID=A0A6A6K8U5_HEVBR|nr:hypothetical protein GH714_039045 [Hevea brasiliensis]